MKTVVTPDLAAAAFTVQLDLVYHRIAARLRDGDCAGVLDQSTFVSGATTPIDLSQVSPVPGSEAHLSYVDRVLTTPSLDGTSQYMYQAKANAGRSVELPHRAFRTVTAFIDSVADELSSLEDRIVECVNDDTRRELLARSGVKAVVRSGAIHYAGGYNQIDAAIPAVESDAGLSRDLLQELATYMREDLKAQSPAADAVAPLKLVGSWEALELIHSNLGTAAALRGIQFVNDTCPLRANWTGAAYALVEPLLAEAKQLNQSVVNSAWLDASHEVAFLIGDGSFVREVPVAWVGTGTADQRLAGGEIRHASNAVNGELEASTVTYRTAQALRPVRPWLVMPIFFKRAAQA